MAGSNPIWLWLGILALSLTSFVESPQLQALVADMATPELRDAAFSIYFGLAFGVGSLWGLLYGLVVDAGGPGEGLGFVFWIMAAASIMAAIATMQIRMPARPGTASGLIRGRHALSFPGPQGHFRSGRGAAW